MPITMPHLPNFVIRVSGLPASTTFYTDRVGFTLAEEQPASGASLIIDSDGDPILLVGPDLQDVTPYTTKQPFILKPGEVVRFLSNDVEAQRAHLLQRGIPAQDIQLVQTRLGDRLLNVTDPDDYVLSFVAPAQHSPEELVALYSKAPDELEAALSGLSEADLNLSRTANSWPIRFIVHHIADGESLHMFEMKLALAFPGSTFTRPWDTINETVPIIFDYAGRSIASSLALYRAINTHITELAQHVPDAWERYVVDEQGNKHTFESVLHGMTGHAFEHIDEILEIRRLHQR